MSVLTPQTKNTKSVEKDFIFQNSNTYTLQNSFTLIYTQLLQAVINLISKDCMASEKVTDLAAKATVLTTDTYHVVDTADTSQDPAGSSYKITWATLKAAILGYFSAGTGITYSGGVISSDPTATQTFTNKTLTGPVINGGTITSATLTTPSFSAPVTVANGGTGAATQAAAAQAILPSMTSQSGNFLTTDGTNASWGTPSNIGATLLSTAVGPSLTTGQAVAFAPFQTDGGIKIDTSGTGTGNSVSLTIGANSNRGLVAFIEAGAAGATLNSASFNGAALTIVDTFNTNGNANIYSCYLNAPSTGTHNLTISLSTGSAVLTYYSIYNVAQTSQPEAHSGVTYTDTGASTTLNTISNGAMVFSALTAATGTGTGSFENHQTVNAVTAIHSYDSGPVFPGATTITLTHPTTAGNQQGTLMLSIAPASAVTYSVQLASAATPTLQQYFNLYTGFVGFAAANISAGATGNIATSGIASGFSGLTPGLQYFLSNTPGAISLSTGTNSRKVGIAISTTQLAINNNW